MELFKHAFRVFIRNKTLIICMIVGVIVALARLLYDYYLWNDITIRPLEATLSLAPYLFILFLIVTYEYYVQVKTMDLEETFFSTFLGGKRVYVCTQFMVMITWALIFTGILILYNCITFHMITEKLGWRGFDIEYNIHIIQNLFINIFLLNILATLTGIAVSVIKRRMIAYGIILLIIYLSSSFFEIIADTLALAGAGNIYPIRELVNVMPINLSFSPNYMFGFSILPYRIYLICFWILLCLFLILLNIRRTKLMKGIVFLLCIVSFTAYCLPSSKVVMNRNINGSAVGDQWYYDSYFNKNLISKEESANYRIDNYTMIIDIGRELTAIVTMEIDKPILDEYKLTLYHDYKVSKIVDQNSDELEYEQEGDYITIKRGESSVKKLTVFYQGYSAKYYSNYQGTCLPGNFIYYPRAGFCKIGENNNNGWISSFLDDDLRFDVTINSRKKIYTNLKEVENNHFVGECNGLTIMSGFLKEVKVGGINYIYPYLDDIISDGKNLEDRIHLGIKSLKQMGYKNCTVFIMPNLNTKRNGAMSKSQILSCGHYENFKDLRSELNEEL